MVYGGMHIDHDPTSSRLKKRVTCILRVRRSKFVASIMPFSAWGLDSVGYTYSRRYCTRSNSFEIPILFLKQPTVYIYQVAQSRTAVGMILKMDHEHSTAAKWLKQSHTWKLLRSSTSNYTCLPKCGHRLIRESLTPLQYRSTTRTFCPGLKLSLTVTSCLGQITAIDTGVCRRHGCIRKTLVSTHLLIFCCLFLSLSLARSGTKALSHV